MAAPPNDIRKGYAVTGLMLGLVYSVMFFCWWFDAGKNIALMQEDPWTMPKIVGGVVCARMLIDMVTNNLRKAMSFSVCFLGAFVIGSIPVMLVVRGVVW